MLRKTISNDPLHRGAVFLTPLDISTVNERHYVANPFIAGQCSSPDQW